MAARQDGECNYAGDWKTSTAVFAGDTGLGACAKSEVNIDAQAGTWEIWFRDDGRMVSSQSWSNTWFHRWTSAQGAPLEEVEYDHYAHQGVVVAEFKFPNSDPLEGARHATGGIPGGGHQLCALNELYEGSALRRTTGWICATVG